jgi:hypothetical protein
MAIPLEDATTLNKNMILNVTICGLQQNLTIFAATARGEPMMSKEKQIVEIKECIDAVYGADCAYFDVDGFAIADKIYNAGYRKQEWISVDERLPDKYGDYICCTRKGTIWQLTYNPKYKLFNVSHDNVENAMDVTHWMPFPQAPKMKGGDEK